MPEISFNESYRQIRAINDRVQESEKAKDWGAAIAGLHELLDHPCAHHQVGACEVWDDIHELHKRAGDYDAAIAAKREAVRTGYRSEPQSDADIAECHFLAGRRAERMLYSPTSGRGHQTAWERPSDRTRLLAERRCEHCGYDPKLLKGGEGSGRTNRHDAFWGSAPGRPAAGLPSSLVVSLAWFPRGEWEKATARWYDLLEDLPADHVEYSHRIEAHLERLARAPAGHPMRVAPMTVEGLTAFCAEEGEGPETREARSSYVAEIARGCDALTWPPACNAPCWCGSGRKYKTCCEPIPTAPE